LSKKDTAASAETTATAAETKGKATRGTMMARRAEKAISRTGLMAKGALLTSAGIVVVMGGFFAASALASADGSFTIKTVAPQVGTKAIALSETMGFSNPTVKLSATAIDEMDNITYDWLPLDELDRHDGSYNGENYIAYTFYLRNSGVGELDYSAVLHVTECSRRVDEAVRIMAYRNGEPTIYAVAREDGGTETVPEGVVNFESSTTVFTEVREALPETGIDRWTFVVWLEGEDPECENFVQGGTMSLEMDVSIVGENDEEELMGETEARNETDVTEGTAD